MAKTKSTMPKNVCVLDIETSKTDFHWKANSSLAIAGVKSFTMRNGRYEPKSFRAYRVHELAELESYLNAFEGPVIGYNVFDFDYAVLEGYIDLSKIIPKTVDVFHVLRDLNSLGMRGLKLGVLAQLNCGSTKTDLGSQVAALWNSGKEDEVVAYNENDCDITLQVWHHAITKRRIIGQFKESPSFTLQIPNRQRDGLLNRTPMFSYRTWQKRPQRPKVIRMEDLFGTTISDLMISETEYLLDYCEKCDKTHLFLNRIIRGFSDHEVFRCDECGRRMSEHRSDGGYRSIAKFPGRLPDTGMIAPIDEESDENGDVIEAILKHVVATRPQWNRHSWTSVDLELGLVQEEDLCDICGRQHHVTGGYESPLDPESVICLECLTAQRWRLKSSPASRRKPRAKAQALVPGLTS